MEVPLVLDVLHDTGLLQKIWVGPGRHGSVGRGPAPSPHHLRKGLHLPQAQLHQPEHRGEAPVLNSGSAVARAPSSALGGAAWTSPAGGQQSHVQHMCIVCATHVQGGKTVALTVAYEASQGLALEVELHVHVLALEKRTDRGLGRGVPAMQGWAGTSPAVILLRCWCLYGFLPRPLGQTLDNPPLPHHPVLPLPAARDVLGLPTPWALPSRTALGILVPQGPLPTPRPDDGHSCSLWGFAPPCPGEPVLRLTKREELLFRMVFAFPKAAERRGEH